MSQDRKTRIELLEKSLNPAEPAAVHALADEWRNAGLNQAEMLDIFDAVRARHYEDVDERRYDLVLDVMDRIVGFCSHHNALYPRSPAEDR